MKKFILLAAITGLLFACKQEKANIQQGRAYFEYYSYTGNDAVFNENPLAEGQFYNPILSGFYPDPSICQRGEDFYMVNSTFTFFPAVPIFHSTDLINWKQIGHVLDRPSQFMNIDQPVSYGIFAPAIEYNPHNETFYMITTYVGAEGNFVVTAKDPAGPWSDPFWLPEVPGIDPSLFFDEDGKAYVVNNQDPAYEPLYQGHKAIWIQEFDVQNNKMTGPRKKLIDGGHDISEQPIWVEGPHIYKLNGYYYLMAAEGGTSIDHSEVIFRSNNIWGPYKTFAGNPILTQRDLDRNRKNPVTNTGHADLVQHPNGDWYAFFLGCRPYNADNYFNTGRETFIHPVQWTEDQWPVILESGMEVPFVLDLPAGVSSRDHEPGFMKRGNFSVYEDFSASALPLEWIFIRTPQEKWYQLDETGGIWIDARPVNLRERAQPSFVGTRQRHHTMSVETTMHFLPASGQDLAGLVMFQNEAFHYTLGVTLLNGINHVVLQKAISSEDNIAEKDMLVSVALPDSFKGKIGLKAEVKDDKYAFYYKTGRKGWALLIDDIDVGYLSTERAQGFIGTILGLYASSAE